MARVPVSARGSGRPSALPGQPTNLHPTHPFWSWNFLNSLSKFSCSWRYTAGSLFNIFAILRLVALSHNVHSIFTPLPPLRWASELQAVGRVGAEAGRAETAGRGGLEGGST